MILRKVTVFGKALFSLVMITGVLFVSCKQESTPEQEIVEPQPFQWEYASPESQGLSSQKLDEMSRNLAEKGTKKLLIIKNDKIVYDYFANGWGDDERKHYTASLAKALVGGLSLMAAMDDGYISLDAAAFNYIPSWKKHNRKSKITIRHLATHTSGMVDAEGTDVEAKNMESQKLHHHFDL